VKHLSDSDDPHWWNPNTDNDEPSLAKLRIDREEPM